MHDTVRAQYSEWTRITATEMFFSFRQQDLTLADYITHFKELHDIFVTQNGNGFNDTYVTDTVENFTALDDDQQNELQSAAYEHWIAMFLSSTPMCATMEVLSMIYRPHLHMNAMSTLRLWKKRSIFWITANLIPALR